MALVDTDAFSVGLNEFRDESTEFRRAFEIEGNSAATRIAECITRLLLTGCDAPIQESDDLHPFNRYASCARSEKQNLDALARDVRREFQDCMAVRAFIVSFFHTGGVNYETLTDLHDDYLDWVDTCLLDDDGDDDGSSVSSSSSSSSSSNQ